jgi:hypothetical protein
MRRISTNARIPQIRGISISPGDTTRLVPLRGLYLRVPSAVKDSSVPLVQPHQRGGTRLTCDDDKRVKAAQSTANDPRFRGMSLKESCHWFEGFFWAEGGVEINGA